MQVQHLNDSELLSQTKALAQREREVLTLILRHLKEIERRKLYCDLGYGSLFEYAVRELKYSESQASRRINAMRLIKELPQIETAISSGELSLTNASQAQTIFRSQAKESPKLAMSSSEKLEVVNSLKNKSSREAQKELLKLHPTVPAAKLLERERQVTPETTEVRFFLSDALKAKLEKVRALLGPKGLAMGYGELIEAMAELSADKLSEKRFGKKRAASESAEATFTPAPALSTPSTTRVSKNIRYIPPRVKHFIWQRDQGRCRNCKNQRNLNFDHILPVALGGNSSVENIRLLCFSCNQRQAIKIFGSEKIEEYGRSDV